MGAAEKAMGAATLYEIVGCAPDATSDEVRKAYYRSALKCHPDKHPESSDAHARFIQLGRAFSVLSDAAQRAKYDSQLSASPTETVKAAAPQDCYDWASQWRSYKWRPAEPRANSTRTQPSGTPQGMPQTFAPKSKAAATPKASAQRPARCFPAATAPPTAHPSSADHARSSAAADSCFDHGQFTPTIDRDELAVWKRLFAAEHARYRQAIDERLVALGPAPVYRAIAPANRTSTAIGVEVEAAHGDSRKAVGVEIPEALVSGSVFCVRQHLQPTARFSFWLGDAKFSTPKLLWRRCGKQSPVPDGCIVLSQGARTILRVGKKKGSETGWLLTMADGTFDLEACSSSERDLWLQTLKQFSCA